MADSPAKRRKTSPTTSVPIDAPATPSRIPVPIAQQSATKTSARRPSFASPTKASLARHNPQLLNRPSSSGLGAERPVSRGRNLQDVFAKALGEAPPTTGQSIITGEDRQPPKSMPTTLGNEPQATEAHHLQSARATTPKQTTKLIGGGLSTKPRRLSRSPVKRPEKTPSAFSDVDPTKGLPDDFNPFQKKGLRRSPVPGQPDVSAQQENQESQQENINPFRKTGLRRSPVSSLPVENVEPLHGEVDASATAVSRRRRSPRLSPPVDNVGLLRNTGLNSIPSKSMLRRSPVASQLAETAKQTETLTGVPADVSTTPTEPVPPKSGLGEIVREELPPESDHRQHSDDILLPDRPLRSLGPPISSREPGVAEIFAANRPERPEPQLPPTPVQRGIPDPVVTTPPTGIHDTPSKRARRSKALSEMLKSSPLKPRDPPPKQPSKEKQQEPQKESEKPKIEPVKRRKSARFLIPEDPHAAQKKARDDLLKELQQLQADVALANQENKRLRQIAKLRKKTLDTALNSDELLAMLARATAPDRPAEAELKPKSIFKSIGAFLPFHARRKPTPLPVSDKPLPSHLPIALDDPLPNLQAFSTLTFSSTITLFPSRPIISDESTHDTELPLMQKHLITASHPSGLFTTRFAMTIDTTALTISSIDVLRLDMNAEKELGTFIRGRARDEGPLGKDVTVICWAMSRWTEVSVKRAQFWCTIEQEFGTPEARRKSFQRKRKRKRYGSILENDDSSAIAEDEHEKVKWTRKQLLPHFGRSSMELSSEEVELRFEWKIGFDWTGEVESLTAATARVPKSWQEVDERSSLSKVPETFERLKMEQGPLGAVRAIVGLLMSAS